MKGFLVFLALCALTFGWERDYTGYTVQRCSTVDEEKRGLLFGIFYTLNIDILADFVDSVDIIVPQKHREIFEALHCNVRVEDVQKQIDQEEITLQESRKSYFANLNNFARVNDSDPYHQTYHTYSEIVTKVNAIAAQYPSITRVATIATSIEGRALPVIHIKGTSGPVNKQTIYLMSGIHAREWIGPATAVYVIQNLAEKYGTDTEVTALLNAIEFVIAPITNPDGYNYAWTSDRMWRKNRNQNSGNTCKGVDLNRNFDVYWGTDSSNNRCAEDYHGTSANSEPEVSGMQNYVSALSNKIGAIDIHSYGQYIMRPYGWTYDLHPQETILKRLGDGIVAEIRSVTNTAYSSIRSAELYPVSGASDDWFTVELGLWGFCFELRDRGLYGFRLPEGQILGTGQEIFAAIKYYANFTLENFSRQ